MSATINATELRQLIEFIVRCKEYGITIPLCIHGMHGIGKTEIVKQIGVALGYHNETLNLSTQDIADLVGIPYRCPDTNFTKNAIPQWFGSGISNEKPTIFFLDEMNRAEPYVLQTMLPFALEGRIHRHNIRSTDIVISAMNPETTDYNVTSITDKALLARFLHVYFEPTASEWVSYNRAMNIHFAVLQAVEQHDRILGKTKLDSDQTKFTSTPDPRKLSMVGKAMNLMSEDDYAKIGFIFLQGMIGTDAASIIQTQFKKGILLSSADIYNGKVFTYDSKHAANFNVAEEQIINFETDLDKIDILLDQLADDITTFKLFTKDNEPIQTYTPPTGKPVNINITNIQKFLMKTPLDIQFAFLKKLKVKSIENKMYDHSDTDSFAEKLNKALDIIFEYTYTMDVSKKTKAAKLVKTETEPTTV